MKIKTNTNKPVKMDVNTGGRIDMSIVSGGGGALIPTYKGEYEVIPKAHDTQTLETQGRKMTENVVVLPVPYWEFTNPAHGNTVYIANE